MTEKGNLTENLAAKRKDHLHNAWWELHRTFEEDNYELAERKELTELMKRIEALRVKQDKLNK